jgi:aspartate aminotransferase
MFEEGIALRQQHGADKVFDLTLGNPVFDPPPEFHQALRDYAAKEPGGRHRYMENAGFIETRAAVARQLTREFGLNFKAPDVMMTVGAAGALNVVLKSIVNLGDEVVILAPYFAEYFHYINNHYGTPRVVPFNGDFLPKLEALEAAIGPRTRAVILNSPNNPSGMVYGADFLQRLGRLLGRKELELGQPVYLLSDEPYRRLIYDGLKFPAPVLHHRNTIIINSHSKDLALPGERIGYIAVHPEVADREELLAAFNYCNRTLGFVNAPAIMQHVVRNLQHLTVSVAEYQRKRDFLFDNLTALGFSVHKPQGAFYMFPKTPIPDDVAFVRELQKDLVLTVPGSGFGAPGYFRASFCLDDHTLRGSLEGFRRVARHYKLI